jgi:hypothetical protein
MLVGDASSQSEHSLQRLHRSKVLARMSQHVHDVVTVRVLRWEGFGDDGGKYVGY